MMDKQDYRASIIRAEEKRARLIGNAQAFKARISPARLKADAKASLRGAMYDTKIRTKAGVRRHPIAVGVIGTGLLAWLFRRPIARLISRFGHTQPETVPLLPVDPVPQALPSATTVTADPPVADSIAVPAAPPIPETEDEK